MFTVSENSASDSPAACADCGGPVGKDNGPPNGWKLEGGRMICHACCVADFKSSVDLAIYEFHQNFEDHTLDVGRKIGA